MPTSRCQVGFALRRRRTLEAEIRRAGNDLWEQDNDNNLDDGILTGVGSKNMQGGFLARGGGGGSPVYMGVGYVQGARDRSRQSRKITNSVV